MHKERLNKMNMNRRTFLEWSLAAGTLGLLAGCQSAPSSLASTTSAATQQATTQSTATATDWSKLAKSLQGPLVRPGSAQYATAHQLYNPRFDTIQPAGIAYCSNPKDVQTCLAFARRFAVPLAIRAGGHSYAGYSTTTGLVLDVTRMNGITVDTKAATATIGGGARLIDVYSALAQHGMVLPAGSCPTVGIAGLTLGGGVGVLGRKFGLTCDNLLSAQVVVADGRMLTCTPDQNADLFWALQGGGGGNFGVVTSFTFRTHSVSDLTLFTLRWPWSSAATVLGAWQAWAPQAPDELWSNCLLETTGNRSANPLIQVNGVYVGPSGPLNTLLQQLTSKISVAPLSRYVAPATILDTMLYEAGCFGKTVAQCHLPNQDPQGLLQRELAGAKSDYFTKPLSTQGINALINAIAKRQGSPTPGGGAVGIDAYGGAINRVAPDKTAFVHRNTLFSAQYNIGWTANDSASVVQANYDWLNQTWQSMRPFASGSAYQNYIDPNLTNWQQAYYGANLARLQHIKASYDPGNLFHFAQSIPPTK